jgi:hypothetical protein
MFILRKLLRFLRWIWFDLGPEWEPEPCPGRMVPLRMRRHVMDGLYEYRHPTEQELRDFFRNVDWS